VNELFDMCVVWRILTSTELCHYFSFLPIDEQDYMLFVDHKTCFCLLTHFCEGLSLLTVISCYRGANFACWSFLYTFNVFSVKVHNHIVTSAKEVMFSVRFVCVCVCLFV